MKPLSFLEEYPLSQGQRALWFLQQLNPLSVAHNIPMGMCSRAAIDPRAVDRAVRRIVIRHPALRTTFTEVDGEPVQRVHADPVFHFAAIDTSSWPTSRLDAFLEAETFRPFDLQTGPLLRVFLLSHAADDHILFMVKHHIITDMWSSAIFLHDLSELYQEEVCGIPAELFPAKAPYRTYVQKENELLASPEAVRLKGYWQNRLAGPLPALNLPYDHPRPPALTDRGRACTLQLPVDLSDRLRAIGRSEGVPLYQVALDAFQVLLYRYSGQDDLCVGFTKAGRTRDMARTMGYFINPVVLRADLSGNPTFSDYLKRNQTAIEADFRHEQLPFVQVVEAVNPLRDPSLPPLFQVAFSWQKTTRLVDQRQTAAIALGAQASGAETGGLHLAPFPLKRRATQVDLTLMMAETENELSTTLEYNTDLFEEETIQRMLAHFQCLLTAISEAPSQRLSTLRILEPAEARQVVYEWNDTSTPFQDGLCLHQLVAARAAQCPASPAVSFEGHTLSYYELDRQSNQLAHYLANLGVGQEIPVAVCLDRSIEIVIALLGILKAGGAYVPLDPGFPAGRLADMLAELAHAARNGLQGSAPLLLTQAHLLDRLGEHFTGNRVVCLDSDWPVIKQGSDQAFPSSSNPEHLAYIIFTSGSTGRPKGVQIPHRAIVNLLTSMQRQPGLVPGDVLLAVTTLSFDIAALELFLPLITGAQIAIVPRQVAIDGQALARAIDESNATVMQATPATWRMLIEAGWAGDGRLKILCGGEALSPDLAGELLKRGGQVWNLYGPTETTVWSTLHRVTAADSPVPIGKPIANTRLYILDAGLQPVPVGVVGDLYIAGAGLARGYLNQPELTAERFLELDIRKIGIRINQEKVTDSQFLIPDSQLVYRTGDLARWLPGGAVEFLGRQDQQVKLRGYRVELGEIENTLAAHPLVSQAVVVAKELQPGNLGLVAYLALNQPDSANAVGRALRAYLEERLPEYMLPAAFIPLTAFPLTPNNKIDRRALAALPIPQRTEFQIASSAAYVAPRTPEEERVARVWKDILGVDRVGAWDNFFELGGHSLLATRVMSRLLTEAGVELPIQSLFEAQTVAALAERVGAARLSQPRFTSPPILPIPRTEELPLSFSQLRQWFLESVEPGTDAYNINAILRVRGPLDPACLERSLEEIHRRHEALRTTFRSIDGRPIQVISPPAPFSLPVIDLQNQPSEQRTERALALAGQEIRKGFDLSTGPLLRAALLRLEQREFLLVVSTHHIVSDGWSMGVLLKELSSLYEAFAAGKPSPLHDLAIQYADYAAWQQAWLQGETLKAQLDYWISSLSGSAQQIDLPTDRPRPPVKTYSGDRYLLELPEPFTTLLKTLGEQEGATLFMTLLAAFNTLLYRYTGQNDINIGTYIANRTRPEVEDLIGFFVNTLVLRTGLSPELTFSELLRGTRQVTLEAYAHQDLPFEKLLEALNPKRSLAATPLFQVMLVLQNMPLPHRPPSGLEMAQLPVEHHRAEFDLTLWVEECPTGLAIQFEYNTDLFERGTIARMAGHFKTLLESAVAAPWTPISHLLILTEAEHRIILDRWAHADVDYAKYLPPVDVCIHQLIEAQALHSPDTLAVLTADGSLTYAELDQQANRLAQRLRSLGVGPEIRVGLLLERSCELIIGLLGILKAGGCYVPLDTAYPAERVAYILNDASAHVVLTQSSFLRKFSGLPVHPICLDQDWATDDSQSPPLFEPVTNQNLAYVIYTSGSTGQPKGVMVQHSSLVNYVRFAAFEYGLTPLDRFLQFASISFDFSAEEIFPILTCGGTLVLRTEAMLGSPQLFLEQCQTWELTVLDLPTAYLHELTAGMVQDRLTFPSSVRMVLFGGELALPDRLREFREWIGPGVRLVNSYGPTEATIVSTFVNLPEDAGQFDQLPIGRPVWNTDIYLLDRNLQPVPAGVPGEIFIAGAGLARGYLNRPELTAERFIEFQSAPSGTPDCKLPAGELHPAIRNLQRAYRTGDLARWRPDGHLEFLGRIDQQVKIRGFRVELGEIEAVLIQHPDVREAVVLPLAAPNGEKRLVAYVSITEPQAADPQAVDDPSLSSRQVSLGFELRRFLAQKLPDYMLPAAILVIETLPLTSTGKIDRQALAGLAIPLTERRQAGFVAPRNPMEVMVADLVADVLGFQGLGAHDNFFELGGHSLMAMQVISRLRKHFGIELPVRRLFEHPTIAGIAAQVEVTLHAGQTLQAPPMLPVDRSGRLPLAFSQERMWFIQQIQPDSSAYNIPVAVRITGPLDPDALEATLMELVRRHEILRTVIGNVDGQPVQLIAPDAAVGLPYIDLRALAETERESEMLRLAHDQARRPFDLARGPLLHFTLIQVQDQEYVVLVIFHHAIFDAWSVWILGRELFAIYAAFASGEPDPLPPPGLQYADFAHWQRLLFQGSVLASQMEYWRHQLAGVPVLEIPSDRPRPTIQTFNGASLTVAPPPSLFDALRELSRAENATLFMTLLACFKALLYRYTGQEDIAVGVPIANRHWLDTESMIGTFVNTLVLRTDLSGAPTFRTLLRRVREVSLEAYAHQDLPFEKLVAELQPVRDLSHSPLFQVMFDYTNTPVETRQVSGLAWSPIEIHRGAAQFDLTMTVFDTRLQQEVRLEYNTDLFDLATIERMLAHFLNLLAGLVQEPDKPIPNLAYLTVPEYQQLLIDWNSTTTDFPADRCFHQLFEVQASKQPDALAVECDGQSLTYGELNARANQLARYLQQAGVGPGQLVGISLDRSLDMVIALLGVHKAGGAYLPMDPTFPGERLAFMASDAGIQTLLTQQRLIAELHEQIAAETWQPAGLSPHESGATAQSEPSKPAPGLRPQIICLDLDWPQICSHTAENLPPSAGPEDLAYVLYTSGSTGKPKGVQIEHRALVNFLTSMQIRPGISSRDILLSVTTLSFDIAGLEVFLPLVTGGRVILVSHEVAADGPRLVQALSASSATVMQATPTTWRMLIESGWSGDPRLKILCGGEALSPDLAAALLKRCGSLWNMYGPTETTIWSLIEPVQSAEPPLAIGRPIGNTTVYITDQALQLLPPGLPGELLIGGAGLARGYLNRPELTAERFIELRFTEDELQTANCKLPGGDLQSAIRNSQRTYRTGDRARFLPDGRLEYLGRIDQQVKIRGFRVELGEIEAALTQHPAVSEAVVVAREDIPGDQRLVAYLVLAVPEHVAGIAAASTTAEHTASAGREAVLTRELREFCRQRLPEYMLPSAFVVLDTLPLTPNKKIDRKALPAPSAGRPELERSFVPPRTAMEETLSRMTAHVLAIEVVGVNDNFFELGGYSLLATRLIARIQEAFQIELPLRHFFETPTVAGLAEKIQSMPGQRERVERVAELLLMLDSLPEDEVEKLLAGKASAETGTGAGLD